MPNYYEILKIAPTADTAKIESVLDAQYEQWSNLVTHQDPKLQLQAQQALQIIEQMRTTLLDPVRRQAYNEAIGLSGAAGGLVDPTIVLQMPAGLGTPMTLHTPPAPTATQAPATPAGSGLWTCSKGHDNPPDTHYCQRCGEELVRTCPECGKLKSLHSTGLCGNCGYKYEVAVERKMLNARISALGKEADNLHSQLAQADRIEKESLSCGCLSIYLGLGGLVDIVVGIILVFTTPESLLWVLLGACVLLMGACVLFIVIAYKLYKYLKYMKDKPRVKNLQAEMEVKQTEIARAKQRYDELSLRRSGE